MDNRTRTPIASPLAQRHTVRSFAPHRLSQDSLSSILIAATLAPSAKNRQPWHFFVFSNPNRIDDLINHARNAVASELDPKRSEGMRVAKEINKTLDSLATAPALVLIGYNQRREHEPGSKQAWTMQARDREAVDLQSIGAAIENMALQAASLGIGSLWACDILSVHDAIQHFLGTKMPIVSAIAFGYELEKSTSPQRLPLENVVSFMQ